MSLIADALKAAQDEKRRKDTPPRAFGGQKSYFPLRSDRGERRRFPLPLPLVAGVGLAIPLAIAAGLLIARNRRPAPLRSPVPEVAVAAPLVDTARIDTAISSAAASTAEADAVENLRQQAAALYSAPSRPRARTTRPPARTVADASQPASPRITTPSTPGASAPALVLPGGLRITMDNSGRGDAAALFQQALDAQRAGDYVRARDLYLRVIALTPNNAEAYNNLGSVYRALGDLVASEASYRRAVTADPRYAGAWSNLGAVLGLLGRRQEAIQALQRAVQLEPANLGAKVNLAIQYRQSGLLKEACDLLQETLRVNPSMAQAHYALAQVLEAQGERAAAARHYRLFLSTGAGQFGPQIEEQVRRRLRVLEATAS
jgi:Tfp pilus assembly protein PilF